MVRTDQPRKVLAIDDSDADLALLDAFLEGAGFDVVCLGDGAQAVTAALTAEPDLILLDIMMPGVDGFEACRRIKETPALKDIPVIFMSARATAEERVKGFALGGVDFVEKPLFDLEILARCQAHLEAVTARRKLEAALEAEKHFSALQGEFVSIVSHEFRTPLTIIDSAAQRLERRAGKVDPDEIRLRSKKIRSAVERMIGLIDSVLYTARLDEHMVPFHPEIRDLKAIIAIAADHQADISPGHEIRLDLDGLPDTISADWKLLNQVFSNLLSNAVKYAPDAPVIAVKGWTEGANAMVSVRDHGVGIDAEDIPNLFQRFYRAKTARDFHGTGLGLSVSREFVHMHGGALSVDSIKGEGTTMTVTLPIKGQ
ncbi:MAG: hybrid sensor histidine kinase/response regulator [Alphaproteobacteria bacterium]|nr:hybrid sensor histidine kinase/response regulator [Alphaproteobacteria bacterium]